jgi:hypothetical protein
MGTLASSSSQVGRLVPRYCRWLFGSATRMRKVLTGAVLHAIGPRDLPESFVTFLHRTSASTAPSTALAPLEDSETVCCDKDRGVGIERYMIRIRLRLSSRGEGIVE